MKSQEITTKFPKPPLNRYSIASKSPLPSGKRLHSCYGKSPSIGKINELNGPFSSSLCQTTKGYLKPATVPPTSMSPAKITLWKSTKHP